MNTRERFVKCNLFQNVDRVPLMEIGVWAQTIERWNKEGMPEGTERFNVLKGSEFFGLEHCEWLDANFLLSPPFETSVIKEDERTIIFMDRFGCTRRGLKDGQIGSSRSSMDQFVEFAVESRSDFHALKERFDPHDSNRYPKNWNELIETWKSRDYPLALSRGGEFGFYSLLRRFMGTENACTIFYDDPVLAEEMLDFFADFFIQFSGQVLTQVKPDWYNWFEDFAFKTGPLISPAIFKKFLLPRYRRVNDHLRTHGIDIISLDSDGNIEVLLPMIIEAGFNQICPMEQAAGMNAVAIRKQYGNALAMLGSIDKRELAKGKKEIEREVLRQVPFLLETGGYIPTVDHTVPPDVSYENFLYYLKVKRRIVEGRPGA